MQAIRELALEMLLNSARARQTHRAPRWDRREEIAAGGSPRRLEETTVLPLKGSRGEHREGEREQHEACDEDRRDGAAGAAFQSS
jgi:hypothetical protein